MYITHNVDVLLWNYRGFGTNKGLPSFKNIKTDAEEILQFAKQNNKWDKIGAYGLSMGGLACCHLGR
jgi:alpha-beta hydrolase superfamily lysophospholipase